jgi:hypothetical protein
MNEELNQKTSEQIEFEKRMRAEMEEDMKKEITFGKAEYDPPGGELYREEKLDSPDGGLYETKMTADELEEEISDLNAAKKVIDFILQELAIEGLKIKKENTLTELEEMRQDSVQGMWGAIVTLESSGFDDDTMLCDLPKAIEERVRRDGRILEHKRKKEPK